MRWFQTWRRERYAPRAWVMIDGAPERLEPEVVGFVHNHLMYNLRGAPLPQQQLRLEIDLRGPGHPRLVILLDLGGP